MRRLRPDTALRYVLLDDSEVFSLVGNRVFRGVAEQREDKPYGVFFRLKTISHQALGGASGLKECEIQFNWYCLNFDTLDQLADAADRVLDGFMGTVELDGKALDIQSCYLSDESDGDVEIPDASSFPIYCIQQVYRVAYKAA